MQKMKAIEDQEREKLPLKLKEINDINYFVVDHNLVVILNNYIQLPKSPDFNYLDKEDNGHGLSQIRPPIFI
jgi:hypothetical protein